jgi:hypothetical protein
MPIAKPAAQSWATQSEHIAHRVDLAGLFPNENGLLSLPASFFPNKHDVGACQAFADANAGLRFQSRQQQRCSPMTKASTVQNDERLGWRVAEFCKLVHIDRSTISKMAKQGKLTLVYFGDVPVVPRSEAIRLGLISS